MNRFLTLVLPLSVAGAGVAMTGAQAQVYYSYPSWYQSGMAPDQYQGPHGRYGNQADFIRSLNGTPCGLNCSERAAARWSR